MNRSTAGLAAVAMLCATGARAEMGQGWSVLSGRTVGAGSTVFHGELGWPGISATLLYGTSPKVDAGGRLTFNYGATDLNLGVIPTLGLQGILRLGLVDNSRVNFGLEFAPGPVLFFGGGGTTFAITLPVLFQLGFPVSSAVMVHAGLDIPILVLFSAVPIAVVPLLFGGGVEYFIDRNLAFTFNLRMGPVIYPALGVTDFGLQALIGLAYRF